MKPVLPFKSAPPRRMVGCCLRRGFSRILAIVAVALISTGAATTDPQQQALELFLHASKLQNLKAPASQPFRLRLNFRAVAPGTGQFAGTYSLIWAAPHKWREEIRFADFDEVTVGGDGRRWTAHNLGIEPEAVRVLKNLVEVFGLRSKSREQPRKVRERRRQGATLACVEWAAPEWNSKGEKCFGATGILVREDAKGSERVYSDYAAFGAKMYPRSLRANEEGSRIEASVEELTPTAAVNDAWFMPPENAEEWPSCEDPLPPKVISAPDPQAPRGCVLEGGNTQTILQIVVGSDGQPSQVLVAASAGFDYDNAAAQAIQGWRFHPGMCGKTPIKTQIRVEINFRCGSGLR